MNINARWDTITVGWSDDVTPIEKSVLRIETGNRMILFETAGSAWDIDKGLVNQVIDEIVTRVNQPFDYKKLLMAYMDHVGMCEGTHFLGRSAQGGVDGLNDAELAELRRLSDEVG